MFITLICNVIFSMGRATTDVLVRLLNIVVEATMRQSNSFDNLQPILGSIPIDSRTIRQRYRLDRKTTLYAICPKCHTMFWPMYECDASIYPSHCTDSGISREDSCNKPLTQPINKPIKPYLYHSIFDYIASLTLQPHLERALDKACNDLQLIAKNLRLVEIM